MLSWLWVLSVRLPVGSRLLVVNFGGGELKVICRFSTEGIGAPKTHVVQGSTNCTVFFSCRMKNTEAFLELLVFDMSISFYIFIYYIIFLYFTNVICSVRPALITLFNVKTCLSMPGVLDSSYPANYSLFFQSMNHLLACCIIKSFTVYCLCSRKQALWGQGFFLLGLLVYPEQFRPE